MADKQSATAKGLLAVIGAAAAAVGAFIVTHLSEEFGPRNWGLERTRTGRCRNLPSRRCWRSDTASHDAR